MKATQIIMGMPVILEIADGFATPNDLEKVFDYFRYVARNSALTKLLVKSVLSTAANANPKITAPR